ncbi:MAG: diguanylate cyclase [Comamonas sp.]
MADIPDRRLSPLAGELRWLALVWLLVGAALACVLWLDRGRVGSSEQQLLAQQARILSRALERQMATVNGALEVLADAPAHTREEAATGQGWLVRQVRSQSRLHGGAQVVLDAQGGVLVASDASLAGATLAGEPFFQQIERAPSARTLYVGPPDPTGLAGRSLLLSRAIVAPEDGRLSGVVCAVLDLGRLQNTFAQVRVAPDAVAWLLYGEETLLIALDDGNGGDGSILRPSVPGLAMMQHRAGGAPASVQETPAHDDAPQLVVALQTLDASALALDHPITLGVARTEEAIFRGWRAFAWTLMLIYFVTAFIAAGGIIWVRKRRSVRLALQQRRRQKSRTVKTRLEAVLQATQMGVWDWDTRTRRMYYSTMLQRMLGYAQGDFSGSWHEWESRLHPDERDAVVERVRRFLEQAGDAPFESVNRMRRKDGSYQWVELRGRTVERDAQGRPLRIAGIQVDISRRHALEMRLEHLAQSVPGVLFEYRRDANGRDNFPYCTDKVTELFDLTPAQLQESAGHLLKRVHAEDVAALLRSLQVSMQNLTPWRHAYRIILPDGTERWVGGMSHPKRMDDGSTLWAGYLWDATLEHALRERLDLLVENVPGLLYQSRLEPDGRRYFPYASKGAIALYGVTPEQMCSDAQAVFARFNADDLAVGMQKLADSAREMTVWTHEYRVNVPGRPERWVRAQARPQRLPGGAVLWHGYVQDVTEAREQAMKLQEARQLLDHLMREMPVALCMVDENGVFYYRNRAFQEYFGYGPDEVLTRERWWREVFPDEDYRAQMCSAWENSKREALEHGGRITSGEVRMWTRTAGQRTMAINGMAFGRHYLLAFTDQTEQHARSEMLQQMAFIDGLTGIANRRQLDLTLKAEWGRCQRSGQPLAVLMIDIDLFKPFNDLYGHQAGDECLAAVAGALRAGLSRPHDLVARYGGEEFLCVLPMCDMPGAMRKADALRAAVQDLGIGHAGSHVADVVTVSVGVATLVPDDRGGPEHLVALADQRLYRAKQAGRNCVVGGDPPGASAASSGG